MVYPVVARISRGRFFLVWRFQGFVVLRMVCGVLFVKVVFLQFFVTALPSKVVEELKLWIRTLTVAW